MSQQGDIQALVAELDDAKDQRGLRSPVITLTGPAGIGKSEVTARALEIWPTDSTVRVVGTEIEQPLALAGIDQLVRRLDGVVEGDTSTATLLEMLTSGEPTPELMVGGALITALDSFGAVGGFLVIDDAHWIDETSRRIIAFALRRLGDDAPVTLVVERNDTGPMTTRGRTIPVSGLSSTETAALLEDRFPAAGVDGATVQGLTAGNPLAVIEFAASASTPTELTHRIGEHSDHFDDHAVESAIRHRVGALPPTTQAALFLLAVAHDGDDLHAVWSDLQVDGSTPLLDALGPARDAALVAGGTAPRFVHPHYRTIAESAAASSRHRTIRTTLARASDNADHAAWQLALAADGFDDDVADLVDATAQRAFDRGSPIEAARAFEAAARLTSRNAARADRLLQSASAWWYGDHPSEAGRTADLAAACQVDAVRRAQAVKMKRWAESWDTPALHTIRVLLDEARAVESSSANLATALRLSCVFEACLAAEIDLARDVVDDAVRIREQTVSDPTTPLSIALRAARAFVRIVAGEVPRSLEALADPEACQDIELLWMLGGFPPEKLPTDSLNLLQLVGWAQMVIDDWDAADDVLSDLHSEAHKRGAVAIADFTTGCLAEIDRRRGRWASSMSRASAVVDIVPGRVSLGTTLQLAVRARLQAARGDAEATACAEVAIANLSDNQLFTAEAMARGALITVAIADGRPHDALTQVGLIQHKAEAGGGREAGATWIDIDHIDALCAVGDDDALGALSVRLLEQHQHTDRLWTGAVGWLARALHTARTNGGPPPADDVERALALFDELGAPFEGARARLLLAENGLAESIDMPELISQFRRLGARPFAARSEAVTKSSSDPSVGLADLTPAEVRVAVAVAAGRTNGEAAEALFVSVRTVDAHLRSIFRKLDIRNRVELTRMVGLSDRRSS